MEEPKKREKKFNFVDIIILVIILAAAAVFVRQYAVRPGSVADAGQKTYPFTMILDVVEASNESFENGKVAIGDTLVEKNGYELGKIINIEKREPQTYVTDAEGRQVHSPRPGFTHLILTIEGKGFRPSEGGIMVSGLHIYQNKGFEVTIRDSSFWFRVVSFSLDMT